MSSSVDLILDHHLGAVIVVECLLLRLWILLLVRVGTLILLPLLLQILAPRIILCLLCRQIHVLVQQVVVFQLQFCILLLSGFVLVTLEHLKAFSIFQLHDAGIATTPNNLGFLSHQVLVFGFDHDRVLAFLVSRRAHIVS